MLRVCWGARGSRSQFLFFFRGEFFGLGFLGVQVMAGNDRGEGWGVRGIPLVPGARA